MDSAGLLFIVSGPSGAGKTSMCTELVERIPNMHFSISYTTRPPRKGEQNERDYFFVSIGTFQDMIDQGAFAEWAELYGNYYGTTKSFIDRHLGREGDLLFDIDPQGARQLKEQYPGAVTVFVLPPSPAELERRLRSRSTDAPEVIAQRLEKAHQEISQARGYDYLVINKDLEDAVSILQAILKAEKHRAHRVAAAVPWFHR